MKREALVIGINRYPLLKDKPTSKPRHLLTPAADAEAIAQILEKYGNFKVRRLPVYNQNGLWQVDPNPKPIRVTVLQDEISQLFNPPDSSIPDTALLFFAGHGLQNNKGGVPESFLATSDACPLNEKWGVSLDWLRELLQSSRVRQQIVWLDCCYSGGLFNFTKANPGNLGKEVRDRCFIAACRSFEVAYEEFSGNHGILSNALLQCLNPEKHPDGCVSNYNLIDFINQQLKTSPQRPIFHNSGSEIILTGKKERIDRAVLLAGVCPYKGLACFDFNDEDPKYFYGRTDLTDQLLEKVRQGNFLAVLGTSGSGKSSVVRAGLLHQLNLGQRLGGSDSWLIKIFRPGKHPLQRLVEAFVDSELSEVKRTSELANIKKLFGAGLVQGLVHLITTAKAARVMLVVDQFEEAFTLCENIKERQLFFECLLGAIQQLDNKLCLVLTMRADFLGKCAEHEYSGLASKIQSNLVMVKPMNRQELEQAITEPANQVGLEVERELVEQMLADVEGPGSLPLLQYTLTQLWQQRQIDRLTLKRYTQLGGVKETLQKRADEIYCSLSTEEQKIAQRIFRELTQLGEGTEDTRRQVLKSDLVTSPQSAEILEQVLQKLVDARLVVTSQLQQRGESGLTVTVVDVAHEALIRHWSRLRRWVNENREVDRIARRIKAAAEEWQSQRKSEDYLLSWARLAEAENFLQNYADQDLLSSLDLEFVGESQAVRDRSLREKEEQIAALKRARNQADLLLREKEEQIAALERERKQNKLLNQAVRVRDLLQVKLVDGLVLAIQSTGLNLAQSPGNLLDAVKNGGVQATKLALEQNIFRGHQDEITCVAVNPNGDLIASSSKDGTVRLWNTQGNPIGKPILGHHSVCAVTFSPDNQFIASDQDKTVRFWDNQGNLISQLFPKHKKKVSLQPVLLLLKLCLSNWLSTIGWLVVGYYLIVVFGAFISLILNEMLKLYFSKNEIYLFSLSVVLVLTLSILLWLSWSLFKIEGAVTSLTFSPDGKYIVTGHQDKKVRLWNLRGKLICVPFQGHQSNITSVSFSPDSKEIVSASQDKTLQLWNLWGKPKGKPLDWGHVLSVFFWTFFLVLPFYLLWRYFRPGKPIGQRFQGHNDAVTSVAFSPDGKQIVSGSDDKTLRLWDNQGKVIGQPFQGHEGAVTSVAFSPDGQYIVSGSRDRKVRLWDTQGNPIHQPLQGHENDVTSVAFSPDGKYIISGSSDGTVRLWDIHSHASENGEDYLQVACNRLRHHPILKNPETEVAKQACEICQKYVWNEK